MNIGILGAGTWGIALASLLCTNGHRVTVWSAIPAEIDELSQNHAHKNLPGVKLPKTIYYTKDIEVVAKNNDMILFVVPSSYVRSTAKEIAGYVKDGTIIVTAAKGIESGSVMTMTEIIEDEFYNLRPDLIYHLAALSGPTHAEEVAIGIPTSIVAACKNEEISMQPIRILTLKAWKFAVR